jgi:hypothetical protein
MTPLYARIDAIVFRDRFWLMEVELIEPELFFRFAPAAATTLSHALMAAMRSAQESAGRSPRSRVRSSPRSSERRQMGEP